MHDEHRARRIRRDFHTSGLWSLGVHAVLIVLLAALILYTRRGRQPSNLKLIHLDLNLSSVTAEPAAPAAPREPPEPQIAVPPRPVIAAQPDANIAPLEPAPQLSARNLADAIPVVVAQGKTVFNTGAEAIPDDTPATGSSRNDNDGVGIEGPVSLRQTIHPLYPMSARERGEEGRVVLETVVAPDGHPTSVSVVTSSRFAELDRAAVRAIENAVFNPARENDHFVAARARITIVFRLTN